MVSIFNFIPHVNAANQPAASSTPATSSKPAASSTPATSSKPAASSTPATSSKPAASSTPATSSKPGAKGPETKKYPRFEQPQQVEDTSSPWYVPGWVDDLMESIDNLFQTFKDLMSGKLIQDAIENLIIAWADEFVAPLFGVFAKSYLFTPRIAEINVVYKGWSIFTVIGLVALFVGISFLAIRVIRGKKELKTLLYVFLGSFLAVFLSLTILNFVNVGINWIGQIMMSGIVGTKGVSYQGLAGDQILKALLVGKDGITDPTMAAKSLGHVIVDTEGGIFTLIFMIVVVIVPIFFISVVKTLLLIIMAIFVACWISYTAYSGKVETLIGFFNLYVRTLIVGLIFSAHWAILVKMQTDYGTGTGLASEIGVSPMIFAALSLLGVFIFLYYFWIKPIWRAVKDPIHLSGGQVIEKAGDLGAKMSLAANAVGKRLGADGLQKRSLNWSNTSQRMKDMGQKMQQQRSSRMTGVLSKVTSGMSEAIQGVKYSEPINWQEEQGSIISEEAVHFDIQGARILSSGVTINETLKDEAFTPAKLLRVPSQEVEKMSKMMSHLKPEYKKDVFWNEKKGELFMMGETPAMIKILKREGFSVGQVSHGLSKDGTFVDVESGTVKLLNDSEKARAALETVKNELPMYTKAIIPNGKATETYQELQDRKEELPWAKDIRLEKDELWIPAEELTTAKSYIEDMFSKKVHKIRYNLPRNSQFMEKMILDWTRSGNYNELLKTLEYDADKNYVLVPEENKVHFTQAYEAYRKGKTPYWRTKEGKIKVIIDNMPVDHGAPPINGIDMGSFESLQKEMLEKHQKASLTAKGTLRDTKKKPKTGGDLK